jgi:hypothetical protein
MAAFTAQTSVVVRETLSVEVCVFMSNKKNGSSIELLNLFSKNYD